MYACKILESLVFCAVCSLQLQRKALLPKILDVNNAEATLRSAFKSPFPNAPAQSDVSTHAFLARFPLRIVSQSIRGTSDQNSKANKCLLVGPPAQATQEAHIRSLGKLDSL